MHYNIISHQQILAPDEACDRSPRRHMCIVKRWQERINISAAYLWRLGYVGAYVTPVMTLWLDRIIPSGIYAPECRCVAPGINPHSAWSAASSGTLSKSISSFRRSRCMVATSHIMQRATYPFVERAQAIRKWFYFLHILSRLISSFVTLSFYEIASIIVCTTLLNFLCALFRLCLICQPMPNVGMDYPLHLLSLCAAYNIT